MKLYFKRTISALFLIFVFVNPSYANDSNVNPTDEELVTLVEETSDMDNAKILISAFGDRILTLAIESEDWGIVKMLISEGVDVNARVHRDKLKRTLLMFASHWRHYDEEIFQELILAGADVNAQDANGRTPLIYAIEDGNYDAVELLLSADADPDIQDKDGKTPLMHVFLSDESYDLYDAVELLLSADADPDIQDNERKTPLMHALLSYKLEYGDEEDVEDAVEELIYYMDDLDIRDNEGRTALSYVSGYLHFRDQEWRDDIADLLLCDGANPNIKDIDGMTPLLYAVKFWKSDLVELLINEGANPDVQDENGMTPLMHATKFRDVNVVELLFEVGVDVTLQDKNGWTAYRHSFSLNADASLKHIHKLLREKQ